MEFLTQAITTLVCIAFGIQIIRGVMQAFQQQQNYNNNSAEEDQLDNQIFWLEAGRQMHDDIDE